MKVVLQEPESKVCGQACLAMILGVTLDEACELVGHRKGTKTRELVAVLRAQGKPCGPRLIPFRRWGLHPHFRGLAKLSRGSGNWHWVVIWDDVVYDPLQGASSLSDFEQSLPEGQRLTSGLFLGRR